MNRYRRILKNFAGPAAGCLPDGIDPSDADIWFQDETRVGQQGGLTRRRAEKGTRPGAVRQRQFIYAYIDGAVCPDRGTAAGLVLPCVNTAAMKLHIQEISRHVPEGGHALVVADGAARHSEKLNCRNVTLLKLPPYSPGLNPAERIRQYLEQNRLSNRAYKNYEEISAACCDARNRSAEAPERITRMCSRKWAVVNRS